MRSSLLAVISALCATGAAAAEDRRVTSTVSFVTDYRFRGISNTGTAAIQGSIEWTYRGLYLGGWASNTELSDANIELDYYAGYRYSRSGFTLEVSGIYYHYPGEDADRVDELDPYSGQEADYAEAHAGASYAFDLPLSPSIAVSYDWSPDFFGNDGQAHHVAGRVEAAVPLWSSSRELGIHGTIGYQDVAGDRSSGMLGGYAYAWWQAGASVTVEGVTLDVSYVDVARAATLEAFYAPAMLPDGRIADFPKLVAGAVVASVSRTF